MSREISEELWARVCTWMKNAWVGNKENAQVVFQDYIALTECSRIPSSSISFADVPEIIRPGIVRSVLGLLSGIPSESNPSVWMIQTLFEACAGNLAAEWEVFTTLPVKIVQESPFMPPQIYLDIKPFPRED